MHDTSTTDMIQDVMKVLTAAYKNIDLRYKCIPLHVRYN